MAATNYHGVDKVTNWRASRTVWKDWPETVIARYAEFCQPYNLLSAYLKRIFSSRTGHVKPCLKLGGPPPKAKYVMRSIVNKYREGKVKSPPDRGVK